LGDFFVISLIIFSIFGISDIINFFVKRIFSFNKIKSRKNNSYSIENTLNFKLLLIYDVKSLKNKNETKNSVEWLI
jgi:hypothetical protein